jgi:uncharacterized protein DUF4013
MSGVYSPPPPPSPPASSGTTPSGYDFLRPFTFVFDDPRWLPKILIGGVFVLASFVLIGAIFLLGYAARLVRNVIAGVQHPLPEWDALGEYFAEGLLLFCVFLVYILPIAVMAILLGIPAALMSNAETSGMRDIGSGVFGCASCLLVPFIFAIWLFLPASLLLTITTRRFGAAFEFKRVWAFIKNNIGNYLLAIVVTIIARFLGGAGVILLCVGVFFTEFWGMMAAAYAFAEVYRRAQRP